MFQEQTLPVDPARGALSPTINLGFIEVWRMPAPSIEHPKSDTPGPLNTADAGHIDAGTAKRRLLRGYRGRLGAGLRAGL